MNKTLVALRGMLVDGIEMVRSLMGLRVYMCVCMRRGLMPLQCFGFALSPPSPRVDGLADDVLCGEANDNVVVGSNVVLLG